MVNRATFFFVDLEESEAETSLWLPPSLDLSECMSLAQVYAPFLASLSHCFLETIEIASYAYQTATTTATRSETEQCRAIWLATATDHVLVTIPAYNGSSTTAFVAELLSANEISVVSETSGEVVTSLVCEYDMLIPLAYDRSG